MHYFLTTLGCNSDADGNTARVDLGDDMIHDAASRTRCTSVQAHCYQPTTPHRPRLVLPKRKDAVEMAPDSIFRRQTEGSRNKLGQILRLDLQHLLQHSSGHIHVVDHGINQQRLERQVPVTQDGCVHGQRGDSDLGPT